jgi:hypothetical protein
MQSDNMQPCSEEDVKQVIEQTLENAGLRDVHTTAFIIAEPAVATNEPISDEPDPEMDAYLAKFETLTRLTEASRRICEETASLTYLSTGDKKLMAVITMQDELMRCIVEQMIAMNNIFGRE